MESIIQDLTRNKKNYGEKISKLIDDLFPICRSITGNGVRKTLSIIKEIIPIEMHEVATGTEVFDWNIPKEWNIQDAYVIDPEGNKIIDFTKHNLHVLNYSIPVNKSVSLEELKEHLFTLPEQPEVIPYRTSYFKETWGFCIEYAKYKNLKPGNYQVYIDSTLEKGSLTYGEYLIKGETEEEVLISTHICHPSMCNDNLSGIAVACSLAWHLSGINHWYSYRFLFVPGTIGSITWLSQSEGKIHHIKHGLVASLLGDKAGFTYKKSRRGNADIDRAAAHILNQLDGDHRVIDFFPYGYDERQYCSPGFNLPVGALSRSLFASFPEYHTSADNKQFIHVTQLIDSIIAFLEIFNVIENNKKYLNTNPKCEPQLGRRGLYDKIGGTNESKALQMAALWVLNFSDGMHDLLDIAERSGMHFETILKAANNLFDCHLLKEI